MGALYLPLIISKFKVHYQIKVSVAYSKGHSKLRILHCPERSEVKQGVQIELFAMDGELLTLEGEERKVKRLCV